MTLGQEAYELYVRFEKERLREGVQYRPTYSLWHELTPGYRKVWEQLAHELTKEKE